jgi:hypothetical protein
MYKIVFKNNRGSLIVDNYIMSKNNKSIRLIIGECDCYKNTCDCVKEVVFHNDLVKSILPIGSDEIEKRE